MLPDLPFGTESINTVAKPSLARVVDVVQKANISPDAPERAIAMWHDLERPISGARLTELEVMAVIMGAVSGETAVALCLGKKPATAAAWRDRLCGRYLGPNNAAQLNRRLFESRRGDNERSLTFVLRQAPLVRAVAALGLLPERMAVGALWCVPALGKAYCLANSTLFADINAALKVGLIADIDTLAAEVEQRAELEVLPAVAAPTLPKSENKRRGYYSRPCPHCKREGHSGAKCWTKYPELKPKGFGDEAPGSEYCAIPVGRDVFVVDAVVSGSRLSWGWILWRP